MSLIKLSRKNKLKLIGFLNNQGLNVLRAVMKYIYESDLKA